jgi:hypothetical protein
LDVSVENFENCTEIRCSIVDIQFCFHFLWSGGVEIVCSWLEKGGFELIVAHRRALGAVPTLAKITVLVKLIPGLEAVLSGERWPNSLADKM